MRSLFFDIPEPGPEPEDQVVARAEEPDPQSGTAPNRSIAAVHPADLEENRPEIEQAPNWQAALELLPKDIMGQPDWAAALREGVIMPRALDPEDRSADLFKLDFYLKGPSPMFDAFFPHSTHLQWMGCDSCHPSVFKYRDNEMSMAAINKGEYCGACHGKVAFAATSCKRCHTNM